MRRRSDDHDVISFARRAVTTANPASVETQPRVDYSVTAHSLQLIRIEHRCGFNLQTWYAKIGIAPILKIHADAAAWHLMDRERPVNGRAVLGVHGWFPVIFSSLNVSGYCSNVKHMQKPSTRRKGQEREGEREREHISTALMLQYDESEVNLRPVADESHPSFNLTLLPQQTII